MVIVMFGEWCVRARCEVLCVEGVRVRMCVRVCMWNVWERSWDVWECG